MDKDFISAVSIGSILWATKWFIWAVLLSDPLRDTYDQVMRLATGIGLDFESQFQSSVNSLGASYM